MGRLSGGLLVSKVLQNHSTGAVSRGYAATLAESLGKLH